MKEEKIITIEHDNIKVIEKQVKELCRIIPDSKRMGLGLYLVIDAKYLNLLKDSSERLNIKFHVGGYGLICTPAELKKSNYLKLGLGIFGRGDWTDEYDTQYEETRCPVCNTITEYKQISQLTIDKTQFRGKDISMTSNDEIVVSEKMKMILEENDVTGIKFEPVKHKNNRLKNDFPAYQMFIENILPPLHTSMTYYYDRSLCEHCKAKGVHPTTYFRYKKEDLSGAMDFNYTSRYFHYNNKGEIIISQKVYRLIKENKIRGCRFEIVGEV